MMFQLLEEHEMIRKMVRDFAEKEVAPTAAERDEEERFDREIFVKMAELGPNGNSMAGRSMVGLAVII